MTSSASDFPTTLNEIFDELILIASCLHAIGDLGLPVGQYDQEPAAYRIAVLVDTLAERLDNAYAGLGELLPREEEPAPGEE